MSTLHTASNGLLMGARKNIIVSTFEVELQDDCTYEIENLNKNIDISLSNIFSIDLVDCDIILNVSEEIKIK